MNDKEKKISLIQQNCMHNSIQCCGYAYIFFRRRIELKIYQNGLEISAIIAPVFAFLFAFLPIDYGNSIIIMNISKYGVIVASAVQIILFILSIIFKALRVNERSSLYSEMSITFSNLQIDFKHASQFPSNDIILYQSKYEKLLEKLKCNYRNACEVKEIEKRRGMRYALREFSRKCIACEKVPYSMKSTDCDVCGNFHSWWKFKLKKKK